MSTPSRHQILVVDNDPAVRESLVMVLQASGYDVSSAVDGLDALLQLKRRTPAVVLSDLYMPHMSVFEFLSVVRRRFPQVSVIAMSGAYPSEDDVQSGMIADAFYFKGQSCPQELLLTVADLILSSAALALDHARESTPAWISQNGKDSHGIRYIILTCTECLRSFALSVMKDELLGMQETPCQFCSNTIRYVIDFSFSFVAPPSAAEMTTIGCSSHGLYCARARTCASRVTAAVV
jgi:CheY-like chemotaxis protein